MKNLFLIIAFLLGISSINAQTNPFEELGYTPRFATLSKGQFNEFHDNDTIVQIGSVLLNTKTKQIIAFVQQDTLYSEATLQPDIVSRWISPDPLAHKFAHESPYIFVGNNPIIFIDPDGREKIIALDKNKKGDQTIIAGAEKYKDDGAIHIFGHGNTKGMYLVMDGKKVNINNAKQLESFLSKHSETWQNKQDGNKPIIVLHSCNTGKDQADGSASFAQKISESETFKDATIIAPNELTWFNQSGEVGAYQAKTDSEGEFKRTKEGTKIRSDETGSWRVFQGGKQTGQYRGDWKPKEEPTFIDNITKKEDVK